MILKAKQIISFVLTLCLCFALLPCIATPAKAESTGLSLAQLREKFPDGKYWNHADNPGSSSAVNNQDGYTSIPCPRHGNIGTSSQTCNGFQPGTYQVAWQCMGFAEKLGYDATGLDPRSNTNGWYKNTSVSALDNLKPGDIVRYAYDGHSIYVTGVEGDLVTYVDCNSDRHCVIDWDRTVSMSKLRASFTYVRSAPTAATGGGPTCDCSEAYAGTYICATASTALNIRGGHGTSYSIVGSIPHGAELTVTKAGADWAHVTYENVSGYASMDYLKKIEPEDTSGPSISDIFVTDITTDGYTVSCTVTDDSGVERVKFPTWTDLNGQDDLVENWHTDTAIGGDTAQNTYTYRVETAAHNRESGAYITHIYAYDNCGNMSLAEVDPVYVPAAVEMVKLDVEELSFDSLGKSYQLQATVYPENATDKTVLWESADSAVAQVEDGLVTAVGYGTTQITAKAANGAAAVCTVTVAEMINLPAIVEQPLSVNTDSGETVTFHTAVTGDAVSYQWEYRKLYKWYSTALTGFDTQTLTVDATGARNGYNYRCVITFADGTVLCTEPAELTVNTYITDVQSPNNQTAVLGYKGQFTANAQGEGLKYQWEYRRPDGERWIETAMEGATKQTVYIESTTARDGYQYRCAITDITGQLVYTEPATMRVLSFTAQPTEKFSPVNGTVQFAVATSVADGFTYQWQYRRSETATWTNTTMEGFNTDTLTVSATKARNGYQYRCVLTGSKSGKLESKPATLHVAEPVAITAQPEDYTGAVGEHAVFAVRASNAYTYRWQYARKGSDVWYTTTAEGNQTAQLTVAITTGRNGYQYRCVITGLDGNIYYTNPATLMVN